MLNSPRVVSFNYVPAPYCPNARQGACTSPDCSASPFACYLEADRRGRGTAVRRRTDRSRVAPGVQPGARRERRRREGRQAGAARRGEAAGMDRFTPRPQGDAYRETVLIGPYTTQAECDGRAPETLQKALAEYAELYLGGPAPPASSFSAKDLDDVVKDRFEETIQSSVGPMIQLHLLLEFDRGVQKRIQEAAERALIDRRLWRTGTSARRRACGAGRGLGLLEGRPGQRRGAAPPPPPRHMVRRGSRVGGLLAFHSRGIAEAAAMPREIEERSTADRPHCAGEAEAWNELIARYEGRLLGYVIRRTPNRAAAEDLVQETFIGFLTSLPNYDCRQSLEGYLFSIAAHKLTDLLRRSGAGRRSRLADSSSDPRQPVDRARPASSLVRSGERRGLEEAALAAALAEQIAHWRRRGQWERLKCGELLLVRGWSNKEAAARLGLSEQTVANYKFEMIDRLRAAVRKQGLPEEVFPELGIAK